MHSKFISPCLKIKFSADCSLSPGQRVVHLSTVNFVTGNYLRSPGGSDGKESACNAGDLGSIPGSGRAPGEGNTSYSSILAWIIPWTEEPCGQSWT